MLSGWQCLRERKRDSPQYPLMVMVVSVLRNTSLIARFMGPKWGPSGADRTQVGPMLAPWTLLSGMDCRNQDIVGENCVRYDAGDLALTDENKMKAWVEHYTRLLNVEFEWPSNELPGVPPTAGPPPSLSATLIHKALNKMSCSKAAGPSGIVAEMLKAAGEEGVELVRQLTGCFQLWWEPLRLGGELHSEAITCANDGAIWYHWATVSYYQSPGLHCVSEGNWSSYPFSTTIKYKAVKNTPFLVKFIPSNIQYWNLYVMEFIHFNKNTIFQISQVSVWSKYKHPENVVYFYKWPQMKKMLYSFILNFTT